jgi:hypothetical protein
MDMLNKAPAWTLPDGTRPSVPTMLEMMASPETAKLLPFAELAAAQENQSQIDSMVKELMTIDKAKGVFGTNAERKARKQELQDRLAVLFGADSQRDREFVNRMTAIRSQQLLEDVAPRTIMAPGINYSPGNMGKPGGAQTGFMNSLLQLLGEEK